MMRTTHKVIGKQQGAALVIGLVLLVVLTLLAVTGMNTASSELLMAGNEQYRQNAFQASEAGIEQALSDLPTMPQSGTPVVVANQAVPGSTSDEFTTYLVWIQEVTLIVPLNKRIGMGAELRLKKSKMYF